MAYIEKDDDCNCNNIISSSDESSLTKSSEAENLERWGWLINGWDKMDFKQKLGLFLPYLYYVNARNYYKKDFDEYFSREMINTSYYTCRNFVKLKFDPDGQGTPNMIMEFAPIDPDAIPDATIKSKVKEFGRIVGMYKCIC